MEKYKKNCEECGLEFLVPLFLVERKVRCNACQHEKNMRQKVKSNARRAAAKREKKVKELKDKKIID